MNVRVQKKYQTFVAITRAAEESFGQVGFDATSMESIADVAGVSAGTVYNYFGTKNTVLAAVVTGHMDEIMAEAGERFRPEALDPVDALMPMVEVYLDAMTSYGPDLLKELLRSGFDPAQSDVLEGLVSSDERVMAQLSGSLRAMRSYGSLSVDVEIEGATLLVYSIVAVALMMFASIPGTAPDEVTAVCRAQLGIAFDGLAAR